MDPIINTPAQPAAPAPAPAHHRGVTSKIIIIIILIVIGGGVAWAYQSGALSLILPLGGAPYTTNNILSQIVESNMKHTGERSMTFNGTVSVQATPRDTDAQAFTSSSDSTNSIAGIYNSIEDAINQYPTDIALNVNVDGSTHTIVGGDMPAASSTQVDLHLTGAFETSGISMSAEGEMKVIDGITYVIVHKLPVLGTYVQPIIDKWVEINQSELQAFGVGASKTPALNSSSLLTNLSADQNKEIEKAVADLFAHHSLFNVIGAPTKVNDPDNGTEYQYDLSPNWQNVSGFLDDYSTTFLPIIMKDMGTSSPAIMQVAQQEFSGLEDAINNHDSVQLENYLNDNMKFSLFVKPNGDLAAATISLRIIPTDVTATNGSDTVSPWSDKQLTITYKETLAEQNPPVAITVPDNFMTTTDAIKALTAYQMRLINTKATGSK
jgi:hypothetical protein